MKNLLKQYISAICAVCIILIGTAAAAENNIEVLGIASGGEVLAESEAVTRAEFVTALIKLMRADTKDYQTDFKYGDVKEDSESAPYIYTALKSGWVDENENFLPNGKITADAAVKLAVCAARRKEQAEHYGGYPTGYRIAADNAEMYLDFKDSEKITSEEAKQLFMSVLESECVVAESTAGKSGTVTTYRENGKTWLETLYGISKTTAIVNATTYNSLKYGTDISETMMFEADGDKFYYDGVTPDMLGYEYDIYFTVMQEEAYAVYVKKTDKNKETAALLEDCEINGSGEIEYYSDNGKSKRLRLDSNVCVTVNGRTVSGISKDLFEGDGNAVFTDNNNDGRIDLIKIEKLSYVTVGAIDRENGYIGDANSEECSLYIGDCDEEKGLDISDSSGQKISLYEINTGNILAVKKSEDLKLISIVRIDSSISGAVKGYDAQNIRIDEMEYPMSSYVKKYLKNDLVSMEHGIFYIYDGRVAGFLRESEGYRYGFLIDAYEKEEDRDTVIVKLYTSKGKIEYYECETKLMADGKSNTKSSTAVFGGHKEEIIRYSLNKSGKISKVDFAEDYDEKSIESENNNDNLIYYPKLNQSMRYRSSKKVFNGYFGLENTICMVIPENLSETDSYQLGAAADLLYNDTRYTPMVYDLKDDGNAAVIVIRGKIASVSNSSECLVGSVSQGINEDDEQGVIAECYSGGKFYKYFIPDSVAVSKKSGNKLVPGDVVRFVTDAEGKINGVTVDFDYDNFSLGSAAEPNAENYHNSVSFWVGTPYRASEKYVVLSTTTDEYGEPSSSKYDLKTLSVDGASIVRFQKGRDGKGIIRSINNDEIKTYSQWGKEADYMFLRQYYEAARMIVLYD